MAMSVVECPLGCRAKFPLTSFHEHCAIECPYIEISCPNDCGVRMQRVFLRDHIRTCQNAPQPYGQIPMGNVSPMQSRRSPIEDRVQRAVSAPPSPIQQRHAPAPAAASPLDAIDVSNLRSLGGVLERGKDIWNQIEIMFPQLIWLFRSAWAYWNRMRASDERLWVVGNLFLGIIVAYIFFTPFLFVVRSAVLAFVLYSCWNTISNSSLGQEQQYRGIVSTGFAALAIYLIKMLL